MQSAPQFVSLEMPPDDGKAHQGMPAPPYTYPRGVPASGFPTRQPRDFVVWSLFNFFFMNVCCLGFMALVFSFKSRDRKVIGDTDGAASYGKTAKSLNIAALLLNILIIILIIVLFASGVLALKYQMEQQRQNFDDYFQRNGK
ncbi:dispanin subfamily A member 2b-like [Heteronotia binoei]|uniref:dispanin subfamily A member 2b-like n=1 Tax=Heteronotia binoei TaxID=13085 RepID=UPI00292E19C0|nr:dispanin subfamily A member 2b-like [Heteronotia binoei]